MVNEKSAFRKKEVLENYDISKFEYDAIQTQSYLYRENFTGTSCFFCGAYVRWVIVYKYPNGQRSKYFAGKDCAEMVDTGTNYSALIVQAQKAKERADIQKKYEETEEQFAMDYPQLAQAAEFFQKDNLLIMNVYSKAKFGLTEKQIAFLEKLCLEEWENQAEKYVKELGLGDIPHLKVGEITTDVIIEKYYIKDFAYFDQEKTIIKTADGQTLFTGKTKALIQFLDNDCFFPEDVEEFWQQDKKARKSDFTFGKNYYTQGTKGVATLDVTYVVEEDKTKGSAKIKQFVPMEIADESI